MPSAIRRPAVHKFGGAALADAGSIRAVVRIVHGLPGSPVVVVSALAGVTDLLLEIIAAAEQGDLDRAVAGANRFRTRHRTVVEGLFPASRRGRHLAAVEAASDELEALARALAVLREATPRIRDHVV